MPRDQRQRGGEGSDSQRRPTHHPEIARDIERGEHAGGLEEAATRAH